MNFTHPLEFRIDPNHDYTDDLMQYGINPDNLSEEELNGYVAKLQQEIEKTIAEFKSGFKSQQYDLNDYDKFLKNYGDYLIIEKPTTADNLTFMVDYQFGYMY